MYVVAYSQPTENAPFCKCAKLFFTSKRWQLFSIVDIFYYGILSLSQSYTSLGQSLEYPIAPGARLYLPLDSTILRNLTMWSVVPSLIYLFWSSSIWPHAFVRFFISLGNICILPKIPLFILDRNPRSRMWLNENDSRYLFIIWLKCKWR